MRPIIRSATHNKVRRDPILGRDPWFENLGATLLDDITAWLNKKWGMEIESHNPLCLLYDAISLHLFIYFIYG